MDKKFYQVTEDGVLYEILPRNLQTNLFSKCPEEFFGKSRKVFSIEKGFFRDQEYVPVPSPYRISDKSLFRTRKDAFFEISHLIQKKLVRHREEEKRLEILNVKIMTQFLNLKDCE
jgi:hypothetical protein